MLYDIVPSVSTETDRLRKVIVGLPYSLGPTPTLSEAYDARSYRSIEEGNYPLEEDIVHEMDALVKALQKANVEVLRPSLLEDCNQIFARDVAFVIDDKIFISNMIKDREKEILAYSEILERIDPKHIVRLPLSAQAEGGDIVLYGDILFVGITEDCDFDQYKMARTNRAALDFFQDQLPHKEIIPVHLPKHDQSPEKGILHLDCAFQPVGNNKAVYFPEAFVYEEERKFVEDLFGKDNLFAITSSEAFDLTTNIFSISPQLVVVEEKFQRLSEQLHRWGIETIPVPYYEISKQGGLLRCSTCPLERTKV